VTSNANLGGLFVTVNLDVRKALQQLDVLEAKFNSVFRVAGTSQTLRALSALNAEVNRMGAATRTAASGTTALTGALKGFRAETVRMGGYARVSTNQLRDFEKEVRQLGRSSVIGFRQTATAINQISPRFFGNTLGVTVQSLQEVGRSIGNLPQSLISSRPQVQQATRDWSVFNSNMVTTAALLAPGRAGSVIFGLNSLGSAIGGLGAGGAGVAASSITGIGLAFAALAPYIITATVAAVGFVQVMKEILTTGIEAGRSLEVLQISMEALVGSPQGARREIDWLVQLAKVSPFLTDTLIQLDRMFISQGILAGGLRGRLITAMTDTAAATGRTDDNLRDLGVAMSQVSGRTYLSGDEIRQLVNQFTQVYDLLADFPKFAGKTQAELRKMVEQGEISSNDFFEAYILGSQQFVGASAAMAASIDGIIRRFQDLRYSIGLAFLRIEDLAAAGTVGPLEVIRDLLGGVADAIDKINFAPLALAFGSFLDSVLRPIIDFIANTITPNLSNLFSNVFPRIVRGIGAALGEVVKGFLAFWEVARSIFLAFRDGWVLFVAAALGAFAAFITGLHFVAGAMVFWVNVFRAAFNIIVAIFGAIIGLFTGDFSLALNGVTNALSASVEGLKGLVGAISAPLRGVQAAINVVRGFADASLPIVNETAGALTDVADAANATGEGMEDAAKGSKAAADELARVMNELFDLTRRWFGMRSELEKGLLGDEGFEATIDQIASMGRRLIEALRKLGAGEVANLIAQSTLALMALAEQREIIAERLKNAEQDLEEAINARDTFAAQVRKQAIDFANALRLEESNVTTFEGFSERGFFHEIVEKKQQSFVDALKERLKALKDFFKNIKALRKAGLDEGLLEQLLAAGPEQAGEIAAGLVAGGAAMVGEVNQLQSQIGNVADQLSDFGAEAFYQAGVDQAQAVVDGLNAEMKAITDQAEAITAVVYNAVLPWAVFTEDAATAAGAGAAAGLASGVPGVTDAMTDMTDVVGSQTGEWAALLHGGVQNGLIELEGIDEWLTPIEEFITTTLEDMDTFVETLNGIIAEIDKVEIGSDFSMAKFAQNFFRGLLTMMKNIPGPVRAFLDLLFGEGWWNNTVTAIAAAANVTWAGEGPQPGHPTGGHPTPGGPQPSPNVGFDLSGLGMPIEVHTYIGDTELEDIVQTQVVQNNQAQNTYIQAGRR
jgi:tape measure domain-containing protein